jgi:hypothetical protein
MKPVKLRHEADNRGHHALIAPTLYAVRLLQLPVHLQQEGNLPVAVANAGVGARRVEAAAVEDARVGLKVAQRARQGAAPAR